MDIKKHLICPCQQDLQSTTTINSLDLPDCRKLKTHLIIKKIEIWNNNKLGLKNDETGMLASPTKIITF